MTDRISVPTAPLGFAVDDDAIWVGTSTADKVFRYDPVDRILTHTIPVFGDAHHLAAGTGIIWVASETHELLTAIDPLTNQPGEPSSPGTR